MKTFHVFVTDEAKSDLQRYKNYLLYVKKSPQAAKNLLLDFREVRSRLESVAGSLKNPDSPKLRERKLKKINFTKHDYILLFRVEENKVFVTNVFHALEDYENKIK